MVDMGSKVHPWEAEVKYMFDRKGINFEEVEQFFQEKRDLELGRWRDPEAPEWVAYSGAETREDGLVVACEATGESQRYFRHEDDLDKQEHPWESPFARTARRFYRTIPEPKPWHDAKPGEVWVFKVAGLEFAAVVSSEYEVADIVGKYNLTDFRIESAYKVYPVEDK